MSRQGSPVHIFLRTNGFSDNALPISANVVTQRKLDEDSANGIIVIEFFYDVDDLIYGSFYG